MLLRLERNHTRRRAFKSRLIDITGRGPVVSLMRRLKLNKKSRFLDRLQGLFDWDDGRSRSHWEGYAYRDLAKQAYPQIATQLGLDAAVHWRSTLGLYAARYIWIFPNYSSSRMWTYTRAGKSEENKMTNKRRRKWLSGIYLPAVASSRTIVWNLEDTNAWKDAPWKGRKWMSWMSLRPVSCKIYTSSYPLAV